VFFFFLNHNKTKNMKDSRPEPKEAEDTQQLPVVHGSLVFVLVSVPTPPKAFLGNLCQNRSFSAVWISAVWWF